MFSIEEVKTSSSFEDWLNRVSKADASSEMKSIGSEITSSLAEATPKDSGLTASSWGVKVKKDSNSTSLDIINTSEDGFNVVNALRHGHGTGTGGYVPPNDFVKPIIEKTVPKVLDKVVKKVTR